MRRRLIKSFDHFSDIRSESYADSAKKIHHDGVNILVDLAGYTSLNRAQILALRPSPIQVSYLGYIGTTGADFMDYIIVDPFVVQKDYKEYFTEKMVYLPECYQATDNKRPISPNTPSRKSCGLPDDAFVFCGFNNSFKITPEMFSLWMRLLTKIPNSVLWLSKSNPYVVNNLRNEARLSGINPERVVFADILPSDKYLALYRNADLFLDTLPYNAGTTASDALWAGCPVLTCPGNSFASRMAGSLLRAVGMHGLVTTSIADYEALAIHLANNRNELITTRNQLSSNRMTMPLFDTKRLVLHLESAFSTMWEYHLAGKHPDHIVVPRLSMSS
jgi:predicted O-linked N-acetylglucosamine transferase (SPINDLY family)